MRLSRAQPAPPSSRRRRLRSGSLARNLAASLAPILAGLLLGAGCGDSTLLVVRLIARNGVGDPDRLLVRFQSSSEQLDKQLIPETHPIFPKEGARTTNFSIVADGRRGPVKVLVKAVDGKGRALALGDTSTTLRPGEKVETKVVLFPTDFQVNATTSGSQTFSTVSYGRHVASDALGNFAAVWENFTCSTGSCPVLARLFDESGRPKKVNGSSDEIDVHSSSSMFYDAPAVAMQAGGAFAVAYFRCEGVGNACQLPTPTSTKRGIYVRVFSSDGKPGSPRKLDDGKATGLDGPDIVALEGGAYAVTWSEKTSSGWRIVVQLLDSKGAPKGSVRKVSESSTSELRDPAIGAAPKAHFMVVWRESCGSSCLVIKGRAYKTLASQQGPVVSLSGSSGSAGGVDIAGLPYGYAVVWTDKPSAGPDKSGTAILMRRVGIAGVPLEDAYTLNTGYAGNQSEPTIAVITGGLMLAAWSSASAPQDPAGGIRGRRLLSNGLPVGDDFPINTTTAKLQEKPSLAPIGRDAFIAVFRDHSEAGPDTDKAGIRGRLLYPDYGPHDGKIGALCDGGGKCGDNLVCTQTRVGLRCLSTCAKAGAACLNGGACTKLTGETALRCTYQ